MAGISKSNAFRSAALVTIALALSKPLPVLGGSYEPGKREVGFSEAVPESLRGLAKSEFHTVDDQVTIENDANHFILQTEFGEVGVISNQQLQQTVSELPAIAEIAKISKAGALGDSVVEVGKATVDSTVQVLKNPIKAIKNIPGGFLKMFKSSKEDLAKAKRLSSGETSTMDAINPGYEAAKRQLCKDLGVDPYSRNPLLQAELKRVGGVMSLGAYSSQKMKEVLSDPAARAALSTSEKIWNYKPYELRDEIREAFSELGLDQETVNALIDNNIYTLSELYILSESLFSVGGIPGLEDFLEVASLAGTVYDALFYADIAEFFASYHKDHPLQSYTLIGVLPVAVRQDNTLVVYTGSDHITWTEELAAEWESVTPGLAAEHPSLEAITYGLFSSASREGLTAMGWTTREVSRKPNG